MEENNLKLVNQQNMIKELSTENEMLYHQLNHMMIRNNTLLKRIDDLQQAINDLHIRLEESNLVNNNLLKTNEHIREGYDNRNTATSLLTREKHPLKDDSVPVDLESLYQKWKSFPGQEAKNGPNIRKQALMLANLYAKGKLKASDLFYQSGIGAVTGARYVATLKKFGMIEYTGARKKGHYNITLQGREFIESKMEPAMRLQDSEQPEKNTLLQGIPFDSEFKIPTTNMMDHFDL